MKRVNEKRPVVCLCICFRVCLCVRVGQVLTLQAANACAWLGLLFSPTLAYSSWDHLTTAEPSPVSLCILPVSSVHAEQQLCAEYILVCWPRLEPFILKTAGFSCQQGRNLKSKRLLTSQNLKLYSKMVIKKFYFCYKKGF